MKSYYMKSRYHIQISSMKSHHDFKNYEIISLKSYEWDHDIISLHEFAK